MLLAAPSGGLFQRLYSACLHLAPGFDDDGESPWERVPMQVPAGAFGPGSLCPFNQYFEGASHVTVASIDDVLRWLRACEYVSDRDQFQQDDVWQAPCAFEASRRGDCEDFALWAWRKLSEIGVDAEFFVGRVVDDDNPTVDRQHAWVVYRIGAEDFLLEPAAKNTSEMIQPLDDVQDDYVPHFAIDRRFVTSAFVGCILDRDRVRR